MAENWDEKKIPNQDGKTFVITGANSGIGFEAAKNLAAAGAGIVLAVRSSERGQKAAAQIKEKVPNAQVEVASLDLADLSSIHTFADNLIQSNRRIDVLINNAGVMAPPYKKTKDGFELQFGTNHLGHFALTGLLLPQIEKAPEPRVVTVSSMAHMRGKIDFANLDGSGRYRRWSAYGQSKLSNLLFAYELQRQLDARHMKVKSVACHPGFAATNLTAAGFGMNMGALGKGLASLGNLAAQSAAMGALPTLYAATEPSIVGGEYIGPAGRNKMKGYPGPVKSNALSYDEDLARRLWDVSEKLTGVTFFPHQVGV